MLNELRKYKLYKDNSSRNFKLKIVINHCIQIKISGVIFTLGSKNNKFLQYSVISAT